VAVKKLLLADGMREGVREFIVAARLRNPHVLLTIGVYAEALYTSDKSTLCIVMEYMQNGTLYDVLYAKEWHFTLRNCLFAMRGAASGLNFLHEMGVLHLDVKAVNIYVGDGWVGKVGDFGLAMLTKKADGMEASAEAAAAGKSAPILTSSTPAWCAPELLVNDAAPTKACDVYAFGITMYETLRISRDPYPGLETGAS
jgi:serine/threonine protein kinase